MDAIIDLREFETAVQKAIIYSSRDSATVMNAACLDVIIRAAELIPVADKAKIQKQLTTPITVVSKKTGTQRVYSHPSQLVYNIINARIRKKGGKALSGQKMKQAATALKNSRLKSSGYIAYAGFQKANLAFGGRGFGSKGKLNEKSKAAQGYGVAADSRSLWAEFTNRATAAYEIGGKWVQMIVDWKSIDIKVHLEEKLGRSFQSL